MISYNSFGCLEHFGADFHVWCRYLQGLVVSTLVIIPEVSVLFDAKSVIVHSVSWGDVLQRSISTLGWLYKITDDHN